MVEYPVARFARGEQAHCTEFEHECPDCGIGSIAEVFFELLGGEFLRAVGG